MGYLVVALPVLVIVLLVASNVVKRHNATRSARDSARNALDEAELLLRGHNRMG